MVGTVNAVGVATVDLGSADGIGVTAVVAVPPKLKPVLGVGAAVAAPNEKLPPLVPPNVKPVLAGAVEAGEEKLRLGVAVGVDPN